MGIANRWRWFIAAVVLALGAAAPFLGSAGASASSTSSWVTYDLSSECGAPGTTGQPFEMTDPNSAQNANVFAIGSNGHLLQFSGDGAAGVNCSDGTAATSGPALDNYPTVIPNLGGSKEIAADSDGSLYVYGQVNATGAWQGTDVSNGINGAPAMDVDPDSTTFDANGGDLMVFANAGTSLVQFLLPPGGSWFENGLTGSSDQHIAGDPVLLDTHGQDFVFAVGTNGDLIEYIGPSASYDGWRNVDVSGPLGFPITSDPTAFLDPVTGNMDVAAVNRGGDLIFFTDNGSWQGTDVGSLTHGDAAGAPSAVVDPADGHLLIFTGSANEDLQEFDRAPGGAWTTDDLTANDGAPTVASAPRAYVSPVTGQVAVIAAAGNGHLVEIERRSSAAAPTSTGSVVTVAQTQTQTTITPPKPKPGAKLKTVRVKMTFKWRWSTKQTRLLKFGLGHLVKGSSLEFGCYHAGCPVRGTVLARWGHIAQIERAMAGRLFRAGDIVDIVVSEPKLKAERVRATIRAKRQPVLKLTS